MATWNFSRLRSFIPNGIVDLSLFKLSQSSNVVKGMISMKSPFAQLDRSRRPAVQINDEYGPQITAGRFFFC